MKYRLMIVVMGIFLMPQVLLAATTTPVTPVQQIEVMTVAPHKVDCTGVGKQECLVVNGLLFYDAIVGFDYEEGYNYKLAVTKEQKTDIPADASMYTYTLVRVMEKTVAVDEEKLVKELRTKVDEMIEQYLLGDWLYQGGTVTVTGEQITARVGCNSLMASYERDGLTMKIGSIASTRMMCADAEMRVDQSLIDSLPKVTHIVVTDRAHMSLVGESMSVDVVRK